MPYKDKAKRKENDSRPENKAKAKEYYARPEVALEEKEIVLGGCCVSENDPKWECTDCGTRYKT